METNTDHIKGGKWYNRFDELIIECRLCTGPTTMQGTRLCDNCWELERRIQRSPEIAARILAACAE